jgi:hypothetical protein
MCAAAGTNLVDLVHSISEHILLIDSKHGIPVLLHIVQVARLHERVRLREKVPGLGYQIGVVHGQENFGHVFWRRVHHRLEDEDVVQHHPFQEEDPQTRFNTFFGEHLSLD